MELSTEAGRWNKGLVKNLVVIGLQIHFSNSKQPAVTLYIYYLTLKKNTHNERKHKILL